MPKVVLSSSSSSSIKILSSTVVTKHGGRLLRCEHASASTHCDMVFAIFLPHTYHHTATTTTSSSTTTTTTTKTMVWLSGLTCTDQNFCTKAGPVAFARCEDYGLACVVPDTSPRGDSVGDDPAYDLGQGAGFYVDATVEPWKRHYQMYSYIQYELPALVVQTWPGLEFTSICGHSMGGHGALTCAIKSRLWSLSNAGGGGGDDDAVAGGPVQWQSVSALAPICHPTACPWGQKAFEHYLGSVAAGKDHDATELLIQQQQNKTTGKLFDDILIDQGLADEFWHAGQLLGEDFKTACAAAGQPLQFRGWEGMDHSYYFIAACIADHVDFHAQQIGLPKLCE